MSTSPIRSTTQEHLDLEDVVQNLLLLKDGGAAIILQIGAVNFNLLSEEEQDAIIYSYAALLNSLTFPIEIVIRSQQKDIANYLKLLEKQEENHPSLTMRKRLNHYRGFVEKLVKERHVLDKKCYVSIPFFRADLGLSTPNPLGQKQIKELPFDKTYIIEKALANLEPKRDHLIRQFSRIGLSARQLSTQEIIELFYVAYNPKASSTAIAAQTNVAPLVESHK